LVASTLGLVVLLSVSDGCWGSCMVVIVSWPEAFLVVVVWSGGVGSVGLLFSKSGCPALR
jgi:hypothetical protein